MALRIRRRRGCVDVGSVNETGGMAISWNGAVPHCAALAPKLWAAADVNLMKPCSDAPSDNAAGRTGVGEPLPE